MPTELLFTDTTGLYALDETTGKVTLLAAIAGDVSGVADQEGALAVSNNRAYFAGGDPNDPLSLYESDGTAAGTRLITTFANPGGNATLADFTALSGGGAVFVYYDGSGNQTLWTVKGSSVTEVTVAGGTTPYNAGGSFPGVNLGPGQSGEINGALLFTDGSGLWSLNESTSQVTKLLTVTADTAGVGAQEGALAVANGIAYFAAGNASNPLSLYESDGTAAGTKLITTFANPGGNATLADFTALAGGGAAFVYFDGNGNQTLWTVKGSSVTEVTVAGGTTPYNAGGSFPGVNLGPGQSGEVMPCYVAGTRIATPDGPRPIEDLRAGDSVLLARGGSAPVIWTGGSHVFPTRHPRPWEMHPILVRRDALADGVPCRDLLVSPDHALLVDGWLIEARRLVNGTTILQHTAAAAVHYCHVELARHDLLLAEGAAAESYVDTGNRAALAGTAGPAALHPTFATPLPLRAARACMPFVQDDARAHRLWQGIAARAQARGAAPAAVTHDPALTLRAGTRIIAPVRLGCDRHGFPLPAGTTRVRLRSRGAAPADLKPWLDDRRRLGVAVRRLSLRGAGGVTDIGLHDPRLAAGWWAPEAGAGAAWRWTDGAADLVLPPGGIWLDVWARGLDAYPLPDDPAANPRASASAAA